jgi:Uma2 family endonuclease
MAVQKKPYTVEEFDAFAALPENAERLLEFVGGEIVEVPSNPYSSKIAMRMGRFVSVFVDDHNLGHVTGEAGGYWVSGERYAPDVAFISKERQPELAHEGYNPNPPNLAIEIVSPSDDERKLRIKLANYLAAGTLVWVVYPQSREVEVYAPGQPMKLVDINGVLDGGEALPGFKLAVHDIFPD